MHANALWILASTWVPILIKVKRVVRLETTVCFRITRWMNNQIKNQKKATSKKGEKAMTRMLWLSWKLYHSWVVYHKIQMHSFLKVESLGETRRRKSWNQLKGYDSLSLGYVKRVCGKRKDHRWEKYKSNFLIIEVPTLWNLGTRPTKRLKDSSDVPEARHRILPKTFSSSKRTTKLRSTRLQRIWVMPVTSIKEPEEREFVVDSGASVHLGQQARPQLCCVGDHEDIKKSDDGDDGQRRGANKRRSDCICQRIGLIRYGYASWRNSRSSFSREALWRSWVYQPLDQRSKTTSHQKWQEKLIAKNPTLYRLWFLDYLRVLPHLHLHLPLHHLLHRSQYRRTEKTDILKIQCQKEVEVRMEIFWWKPAARIHRNNWRITRSTKRCIAWIVWLTTGIQRNFGWWKYFNRALGKPRARKLRHFQVISWTSNGAASKSGTVFG